jgi:hypothetical protein
MATIVDDDPPPAATIEDVTVKEGDSGTTPADFTVALNGPSGKPITIDWATKDGTATAGSDYTSGSGTLSFAPGETTKTITLPVLGDTATEPDETFTVELSNPVDVTLDRDGGVGTIKNDDVVPPPSPGRSVNIEPEGGKVLVRVPGTNRFVPLGALESVPVGSTIDASHGRVGMTSTGGSADFYSGQFVLHAEPPLRGTSARGPKKPSRVTEIWLAGGSFKGCPKPKPAPKGKGKRTTAAAAPTRKVIRRLWGNGKGNFRTRGRFSAATVRGTIWLTEDRCDGTLTRVVRGTVTVVDLKTKRTVVVRAGHSYLAPAS